METKLYKDMTAAEQLDWVTRFSSFDREKMPLLEQLGDAWEAGARKDMETGLKLLNAFSYARNFVKNSFLAQDYSRRISRLRYYVDRIKADISQGVVVKGIHGEQYAYIPSLQQQARRRGRPTREEVFARNNKADAQTGSDTESKKQQKIAELLGMKIITNVASREKNNEELAKERQEKAQAEAEIQPSLFKSGKDNTPECFSSRYKNIDEMPVSSRLPHLDQMKWLLSPTLAEQIGTIRNIRATAAAQAERAKVMAEQGAVPSVVEPIAKEAALLTEQYENIYERVDKELATVYLRLKEDGDFAKDFVARHHLHDTENLISMLRPYYIKQPEEFTAQVRKLIEESNPGLIAAKKEAEERKKRSNAIIKYLTRKDKPASKKRVEGMTEKFKELETLIGKEQAAVYLPLLEKTKKEYEKANAEDVSSTASNTIPVTSK